MERKIVYPATAKAITAAAMARALSRPLTPEIIAGRGIGAEVVVGEGGAGRCTAVGALETGAAVLEAVTAGAGVCPATGAAADVVGAATPEEEGVGRRTVGAAVGFGGKLMRTVSVLGCTLAASPALGGTAPGGKLGIFSAIKSNCAPKLKFSPDSVKLLFRNDQAGGRPTSHRLQSRSSW
jgi:hypothetical protein